MQNIDGDYVDLYIPRKCSTSNRIIGAKEHNSVQINIAVVDACGRATSEVQTIVLSGKIRASGFADSRINDFIAENGIVLSSLQYSNVSV